MPSKNNKKTKKIKKLTIEEIGVWNTQLLLVPCVLLRLDRVIPPVVDQLDQREIVHRCAFIPRQNSKYLFLFQGVQTAGRDHVDRFPGIRELH